MKKMSYKKSGVDIKKANHLVQWIKTKTSVSLQPLGNDYACLWPFSVNQYKNPVLAASTDGVGTKLKLAGYFNEWEGIGQDLVAMCVNDLICTGAKPLFFLDYYACGKLSRSQAQSFFKGLERACREAVCPLLGGETAELPGFYRSREIDCAGFCVGVVERSKILKAERVKPGDDIVAFKSSGFHSNGYSLLRKIYKSPAVLKKNKKVLMKPTRLYTFLVPFLEQIKGLRAIAHITGGGLDNISRILPQGLKADLKPWPVPPWFLNVKHRAKLSWRDLLTVFNCGLGLVLIVKDKSILSSLFPSEDIIFIGKVKETRNPKTWNLDFKSMEAVNARKSV